MTINDYFRRSMAPLALVAILVIGLLLPPVGVCLATPVQNSVHKPVELTIRPRWQTPYSWSNHLSPYSTEELAQQTPLILIHGIGSTGRTNDDYDWEDFIRYGLKNPTFSKRFKIYLFHYNSAKSVPELSELLRKTLRDFIAQYPNKKFRVLAHSEGGILFRNAINDPIIEQQTEKAITLGTPFHGSPLANMAWVQRQVSTDNVFSPLRIGYRMSYWIARKQHPSFEKDFAWDNFDQALSLAKPEPSESEKPSLTELSSPFTTYHLLQTGIETSASTLPTAPVTPSPHIKIVTYGSYFGTDNNADQEIIGALGLSDGDTIKERKHIKHWFSTHSMFNLVRNCMAKLPVAFKEAVKSASTGVAGAISVKAPIQSHMLAFNDGISPISSTLWLGRYIPKSDLLNRPAHAMWTALKGLRGTGMARLMPAVDHRNWLEGKTRNGREAVPDLLNPDEPPRLVFDWVLNDLML